MVWVDDSININNRKVMNSTEEVVIILDKEGELYMARKNGEVKHYRLLEMKWSDYEQLYNVQHES